MGGGGSWLHERRDADRIGRDHPIADRTPTNGILLDIPNGECFASLVEEAMGARLLIQFIDVGFLPEGGSGECVFPIRELRGA